VIPPTPPSEALDCRFAPIFGRRLIGPSTFSPAYQLVLNSGDHLRAAHWDVITWAERVHRASVVRAAALAAPEVTS
jgi:hypothetical protein